MTKPNLPILSSGGLTTVDSSKSLAEWGGLTATQIADSSYLAVLSDPCPPHEARREELLAYRLVSNDPPIKDDFLPTYMEHPHREFPPKQLCNTRGVSVFKNEHAAHKKKVRFPKGLGDKSIASGKIYEKDGKVMETGSSHHMTWWLETETPHLNFSLVKNNAAAE
ncbi:MAG: hypothetical protein ACYCY7_03465 [Gallionella sp.]